MQHQLVMTHWLSHLHLFSIQEMFGLLWSDVESCRKWKIKVDWERQSVSKCQSMCKNCLKAISSMKGRLPKDIFLKIPKYFTPFLIWHPWQYTWKNIMHNYDITYNWKKTPAQHMLAALVIMPSQVARWPGVLSRAIQKTQRKPWWTLAGRTWTLTWDWKNTHLHKILKWTYLHIWLWFSINYIALEYNLLS